MSSFKRIPSAVKVVIVAGLAVVVVAGLAAVRAAAQAAGMTTAPTELVMYPDTILTNGKILTVDKDFSTKQAIAIRDGKILAVGTDAAITRLAGPKTQKMDLGGKTMIPGIIDTHLHSMPGAMQEHAAEIGAIEPRFRDYMDVAKVKGTSIADLLQNIKTVAASRKPGTWLRVQIDSPELTAPFYDKIRRKDLDAVAPNNLLIVQSAGNTLNTKLLETIQAFYGNTDLELDPNEVDATGMSSGRMLGTVGESIMADLTIDHPMQSLYPVFKAKLQQWASVGLTTDSGRMMGLWFQPVFREMERRHEMPIRLAYSALGSQVNPRPGDFYMRLGDITDMGTDMLWMPGAGVVEVDDVPCSTMKPFAHPCLIAKPDQPKRQALFQAIKYGNRVANTHVAGDMSVDNLFDIIEEASAAAGMTPEQIRAKQHNIDHCTLNPRPDQIERGKKLGVIWSCGGNRPEMAQRFVDEYGIEYVNKMVAPVASILKAGSIVAGHGEGMMGDSYFTYPEMLLTRKDSKGNTWGAAEAIDRKELLKMYTTGAAAYVARADRMGSLEPGKFADLVVLDKDYMAIPIDQFHTMHPLLTMVGGKIVYQKEGTLWGPSK